MAVCNVEGQAAQAAQAQPGSRGAPDGREEWNEVRLPGKEAERGMARADDRGRGGRAALVRAEGGGVELGAGGEAYDAAGEPCVC